MKVIDSKEFEKVIKSEDLIIIDLYADWCVPCKSLEPVLNKLSNEFENVKFYKVNVEKSPEIAARFHISSIPYLLFFKNGKIIHGINGVVTEKELRRIISSFI